MPILDKVLSVGEAVRDKLKDTFGEPDASLADGDDDGSVDVAALAPPLDVAGAYALLGLADTATLADLRDAYRERAVAAHPAARRDGPASAAQQKLDRLLEALELVEEHLVPLAASAGTPRSSSTPAPKRKRATARDHG